MTDERAKEIISNERACVMRQPRCGHSCKYCNLSFPSREETIEAYHFVISLLNKEIKDRYKRESNI